MAYRFYAEMRDGRIITICEWNKIEVFEMIMDHIDESDYIARFIISYNNMVINDKVLRPKKEEKKLCLKKSEIKDH